MSRRNTGLEAQNRWVFNRLAEAYRARPPYPEPIVQEIIRLAGGDGRVVELGAGTGNLAIPLAAAGLRVVAVEPARAMLDMLLEQAKLASVEITPIHAAAEATSLPAGQHDLVLLADALQWVDLELAAREASRLRSGEGKIVVLEAKLGETGFMRELQELFQAENPKAKRRAPSVAQFFSVALPDSDVGSQSFSDAVRLDRQSFRRVLESLTFVGPALRSARFEELVHSALAVAENYGGIEWRRQFTLWDCPRMET